MPLDINIMRAFAILLSLMLSGCTQMSVDERITRADELAKSVGWHSFTINTKFFDLHAYGSSQDGKNDKGSSIVRVYIEGDGYSWINSQVPSDNPTPMNPIAFYLAMRDIHNSPVVYLARPCQYIDTKKPSNCNETYWTNRRYSQEVIDATNVALDSLKEKYKANRLVLVGYSGGGSVALLVAAKRNDINEIITVAGVLDLDAWVKSHQMIPLTGSLNPVDFIGQLSSIPQVHYVGDKDEVVGVDVAKSYFGKIPKNGDANLVVVNGYGHVCCWVDGWVNLQMKARLLKTNKP